jgi:hypothetical protein
MSGNCEMLRVIQILLINYEKIYIIKRLYSRLILFLVGITFKKYKNSL